ncbi:HAD family phosphatase [Porphyromonas pogonae]|uniref:HAD family hydrolase n=1 Tax=Porphyromonas pogonae TaxID=867595 RepID=UPI002E769318|nr:HAD family phosphatase [Porphyromonas pogonae]
MIKNIVFDLGGVLIHLNRDESVRRFEALGVKDADEMLDPYLQSGLFLKLEEGSLSGEEFREALKEHSKLEKLTHDDILYALKGFLEEVCIYKFDFIDKLRKDYRIFILSNTNPYIMEYAEGDDFLPGGRKLSSFAEKVYASYQMKMVKPDKKIFEYMIKDGQIRPEETLFLDDSPANVKIADEMGFITYCPKNYEDWREPLKEILRQHAK